MMTKIVLSVAIGLAAAVLSATISRVKKLEKLIKELAVSSTDRFISHEQMLVNLRILIENCRYKMQKGGL